MCYTLIQGVLHSLKHAMLWCATREHGKLVTNQSNITSAACNRRQHETQHRHLAALCGEGEGTASRQHHVIYKPWQQTDQSQSQHSVFSSKHNTDTWRPYVVKEKEQLLVNTTSLISRDNKRTNNKVNIRSPAAPLSKTMAASGPNRRATAPAPPVGLACPGA